MMQKSKFFGCCTVICAALMFTHNAYAVALNGLFTIDPGVRTMVPAIDPDTGEEITDPDTGEVIMVPRISGSTFDMGSASSRVLLTGEAGLRTGEFQNFVLDPDEPHPQGWQGDTDGDGIPDGSAGTGYGKTPVVESDILKPFSFFGTATYVGTNPLSYQSGETKDPFTVDLDMASCVLDVCTISAQLNAWEVMWNGSAFEQGPRPDNTGPFTLAMGIFNLTTREYELDWLSQIKGGPFNGVVGHWHLEGTVVPVPAAVWLFGSGMVALLGLARRRHV